MAHPRFSYKRALYSPLDAFSTNLWISKGHLFFNLSFYLSHPISSFQPWFFEFPHKSYIQDAYFPPFLHLSENKSSATKALLLWELIPLAWKFSFHICKNHLHHIEDNQDSWACISSAQIQQVISWFLPNASNRIVSVIGSLFHLV